MHWMRSKALSSGAGRAGRGLIGLALLLMLMGFHASPANASVGNITEFSPPTSVSAPWEIVGGPDGNIWFTELFGQKIGRITPAGVFTEFPVPHSSPAGITAGPDGFLWFSYLGTAEVDRMSTSGTISQYPVASGNTPYAM